MGFLQSRLACLEVLLGASDIYIKCGERSQEALLQVWTFFTFVTNIESVSVMTNRSMAGKAMCHLEGEG